MHKVICTILIGFCCYCLLSCKSFAYYQRIEQKNDLSLDIKNDISHSVLISKDSGTKNINNIFYQTILSRITKKPIYSIKNDYNVYYELAAMVSGPDITFNIKTKLCVYSKYLNGRKGDNNNCKGIEIPVIQLNNAELNFPQDLDFSIQDIPCKVCTITIGDREYVVNAVLQDVWEPYFLFSNKRNQKYPDKNFSNRIARLYSTEQKYQIVDAKNMDIVIAEINKGQITLYNEKYYATNLTPALSVFYVICDATDTLINSKYWYEP